MPLYDLFPWNISSPVAFLLLFAGLASVAVLGLRHVRRRWLEPEAPSPGGAFAEPFRTPVAAPLDIPRALEVAELRGGTPAVRDAILASLAAADVLSVQDGELILSSEPAEDLHARRLQRALLPDAAAGGRGLVAAAVRFADGARDTHRAALAERGLFPTREQRAAVSLLGIGLTLALVVIGAIRVLRGISLGHPVALLLLEMLAASVVVLVVAHRCPRTQAAEAYLEELSVSSLPSAMRARRLGRPSALDAAIASAVLGVAVGPAVSDVVTTAAALVVERGGSGGCGGGGCGGGGCGGGGCGGGCGG